MRYRVILIESSEGFAVGCPALPGCWTQGKTEAEAMKNIKEAIRDYIEIKEELSLAEFNDGNSHAYIREVELPAA